ncbi:hypothetical protein [Lentibacillus amyloliquefaciens]|uniref:Uncharacterized protein n=1 Tax=Lentibacillus amyloliquefaciens TaxID=1472767 RepID=A0A0U4EBQ2_9BACI|nr:hypothetical protein [Lentibacillus amyloliquefaciens]ALX50433.1 hypothetical protein AOX59_18720 [Lentibacillus amyloliquefaciens]
MTELQRFQNRYLDILQAEEPTRTNRLNNLLDDMQAMYRIPLLRNTEFEQKNPRIMHLFRIVSKSRNFEGVK